MKNRGLNFKNFRKVHEDKNSAVMEHPSGHRITIAKNSLSPDLKRSLSSLPLYAADGTETRVPEPESMAPAEAMPQPQQQSPVVVNVNAAPQPPQVPQPPPYPVAPAAPPGADASLFAGRHLNPAIDSAFQGVANFAKQGGPTGWLGQHAANIATETLFPKNEPGPVAPDLSSLEGPAVQPQARAASSPNMGNGAGSPMGWMNQTIQAEKQFANQAQGAAAEEAKIFGNAAQDNAEYAKQAESAFKERLDEYHNMVHDVQNSHINPNRYVENRSVPQKIATAIGLVLGGIGGGITGQENPAMKFLNAQIDRDVDAQKEQLHAKQNLLSANQSMFRNQREFTDTLRLMKLAGYEAQIKQTAAKLGGAQAQLNAQRMIGEIRSKMIPLVISSTAEHLLSQPASPEQQSQVLNQLRLVDPARAKEIEGRLIPGVGTAQIPIDQKTREQIVARQNLQKQISDIEEFAAKNAGSLNPAIIAQGHAKSRLVQDAYRQANNQGVFKESEKDFVSGFINGDPTAFFGNWRTLPGYRETAANNQQALKSLLEGVGINRGSSSASGYTPKTFRPSK